MNNMRKFYDSLAMFAEIKAFRVRREDEKIYKQNERQFLNYFSYKHNFRIL